MHPGARSKIIDKIKLFVSFCLIEKMLSYTFNYAIDLKFSTCIYKTRTNGQVKPPLKMDDWCTKLFAHDSTDKIVFRSLLNTTIARLLLPTVPMKGFFWQ